MKRLLLLLLPLNLIAAPLPIGPRISQTLARTADLTNYLPSSYSTVRLMGHTVAGDAPAMDLVYDPTATTPTNGINVFLPANGVGRIMGEWSGDVRNAGVFGTEDDAQPGIQRALEVAANLGIELYLPGPADYMLRTSIVLRSNMRLRGDGKSTRLIKAFGPELAPGSGPSPKPRAAITTESAVYPSWGEPITVISTNIEMRDFSVYGLDPYQGPLVYLDSFSHLVADNITVRSWEHQADWGFTVRGHWFNGSRLDIDTRGRVFNDGFHVVGGNDGLLVNSLVYSGDDALVFGSSRDQEIRRWNIANIIGGSSHGHAIRIAQNTNTTSWPGTEITTKIEGINFANLNMFGGQYRNGIALIEEDWKTWATGVQAPGNIRDIKVANSFLYGGDIATHDGVNPIGFRVQGAHGISLDNVTISNSIRSAISAEGTKSFKAHGVTAYANQSDSSGWPSVTFRQDISTNLVNRDIEFIGGSFTAKTNQSVFAFEGAINARVIGASISNGVNAIAFTTGCTNGIFANNSIVAVLNGVNTVGAQLITSIGNRFIGVTNEYSGTPDQFTRLDNYLEISRPDFGPILKWNRGGTSGEFGIIGVRNRFLSAAGLMLSNADGDDTPKLFELLMPVYNTSDPLGTFTTNIVDGLPVVTEDVTNYAAAMVIRGTASTSNSFVLNYGGSDSLQAAVNEHKFWASTNAGDLLGRQFVGMNVHGMTINDYATPVVDDHAVLSLFSETRGFMVPYLTEAARDAISTPPIGLSLANSNNARLESYTSDGWSSAVGGFVMPFFSLSAFNPAAGQVVYVGMAGATTPSTVLGNVSVPAPRSGVVKGYWARVRAGTLGSSEAVTARLMVNGVAVGSGSTNSFDSGSPPIYPVFSEDLNVSITKTHLVALRFTMPNPWTTTVTNFTVTGYWFMD